MPALRDAGKNLARLRAISALVARHGFGNFLDRSRIFDRLGFRPKEVDEAPPKLSTPARFRLMLSELGPTFVKLGQVLSSRPDILPPSWIEELARLQDDAPQMPVEEVRGLIAAGLGQPIEALFAEIDPEPLASASIAQVHAARTRDGDEVVVKVQRPGIEEHIRADLDLLHYFATLLEKVVEETGIYSFTGIVTEFEKALVLELDFLHEADNVRLFHGKSIGRDYVVIPRVHQDLTARTVLTMERLQGVKITRLDPAVHDREAVARNVLQMAFDHMFVDGVFHGDPHPGNLFVLEGNRIGLVDFGLVGHMTRQMQETLIVLCLAVALKDPDTVARLLYKVGVPDQRVNLAQFRADIAEILEAYLPRELKDIETATLGPQLVDLCLKYGIRVPKEYALLTKSAITYEGIVRHLWPEMDLVAVAMPYARRLLSDRFTPEAGQGGALRAMLQAHGVMTEVPLQLSQILLDMEGGKFAVNVKSTDLTQLVKAVRWLGITIFSGMVASALIVGSFVVLAARTDWQVGGVPVLALLGFVVPPMIFTFALVWTLLGGRLPRIPLRKLIGQRR